MKILPYVYRLTHQKTGQFYFGSRQSNKIPGNQDLLQYQSSSTIIKTIGFENFDWVILKEFETGDAAYDYENQLIRENFRNSLILNQHYRSGGISRFKRSGPHTDKTKRKMSVKKKGVSNGPLSEEHKAAISNGLKGIKFGPMSSEQKQKLSDSQKGKPRKPLTDYQKSCVSKAQKGKVLSEETKQKLRRIVVCPYCEKSGGLTVMKRYHFKNCKQYENKSS